MNKIKQYKPAKDYWLYGKHAVFAALENPKRKLKELLVTKQMHEEVRYKLSNIKEKNVVIKVAERDEFDKLLGNHQVHQGVALKTLPLEQPPIKDFLFKISCEEYATLVILDQINDPQNLGATLRSCAAFGAAAVIIPKDNAIRETATVAKASSGAIEFMPIISVANISEAIKLLKNNGYWVAGMDKSGEAGFKAVNALKKIALVFGSEGSGIRKLTKDNCDLLISIPISKEVESLNLSNAIAITLFELRKRVE